MADTIVVAGALAQRPDVPGHAWVFLQHLLGLRRLGWEVHFVDQLDAATIAAVPGGADRCLAWIATVFGSAGLDGRWTVLLPGGREAGVGRKAVRAAAQSSAALFNVMGYLRDEDVLARAPKRVFIDIDPGFSQMWSDLGLADLMDGHDAFVTVGTNIGQPCCAIPTCGLQWTPMLPPVVLERWPAVGNRSGPITSVCTWRGPFGPVDHGGRTYGLRVHEFRRLIGLPRRTGLDLELVLAIDPGDRRDRDRLIDCGWRVLDPEAVTSTLHGYQQYLARSSAEFVVAKQIYTATRSGWFSDRSACYLATGRPVVAQDTGFSAFLPVGEGLLSFTDEDEAAQALAHVAADPVGHGRAARLLAEEHLDSDVVLTGLLRDLDV